MKLVIFDLFGTLFQYKVKHNPYRQLIKFGQAQGRRVRESDARNIMSLNYGIREIANHFEINAPSGLFHKLESQIDEEIESLTVFEGVDDIFCALKEINIQIAICSNLAMPYGKAIDNLLSNYTFSRFLSYEMHLIKPDVEMYRMISESTSIGARESLFVGDNYDCDYAGPLNCGFHARHLIRHAASNDIVINSLEEVLRIVKKIHNCERTCAFLSNIIQQ